MLSEKEYDTTVMEMLLEDQRVWSDDEIVREIGSIDAHDSLNRLYGAGLIHRHAGYTWAARAAIKAQDLER